MKIDKKVAELSQEFDDDTLEESRQLHSLGYHDNCDMEGINDESLDDDSDDDVFDDVFDDDDDDDDDWDDD